MIDPHVHCRDGDQAYKETIRHALHIAENQGVEKIFDMPNTDPPVLSGEDVRRRLKLVPEGREEDYFLYVGATSDEDQLEEAVNLYRKFKEVVGIKLYARESVGDLAVDSVKKQREVYETLSDMDYTGILAAHCEKKSHMKPELWDPSRPVTHCLTRPKKAETEAIKDQIKLAREAGYGGKFHVVHVSLPESVELVNDAEDVDMTCGVTPHHILWNKEMLNRPDGLLYKMNPPLRESSKVKQLRRKLKKGKIDWIETDHAPHPIGEKLYEPYLSGYPSLYLCRNFVENFLPDLGLDEKAIKKITRENILNTFEIL